MVGARAVGARSCVTASFVWIMRRLCSGLERSVIMYGITARGLSCGLVFAASLAICSPIWAQGKDRGGGKGGHDGGVRAGTSGRSVDAPRSDTARSGAIRSDTRQTVDGRRDVSPRREMTVDDR